MWLLKPLFHLVRFETLRDRYLCSLNLWLFSLVKIMLKSFEEKLKKWLALVIKTCESRYMKDVRKEAFSHVKRVLIRVRQVKN